MNKVFFRKMARGLPYWIGRADAALMDTAAEVDDVTQARAWRHGEESDLFTHAQKPAWQCSRSYGIWRPTQTG